VSSSDLARFATLIVVLVSALTLASAQTRAHRRPRPRRTAYVVAWVASTIVLGGFLVLLDNAVGNVTPARVAMNMGGMAAIAALSLAIGAWWVGQSAWSGLRGWMRFLSLAILHGIVVLVLSFAVL
jgi:hypothetical protein